MKLAKFLLRTAAVSALLIPTVVSAVPIRHIETVFYSDATKTVEVGYGVTPCLGHPYVYGERTVYYEIVISEDCPT